MKMIFSLRPFNKKLPDCSGSLSSVPYFAGMKTLLLGALIWSIISGRNVFLRIIQQRYAYCQAALTQSLSIHRAVLLSTWSAAPVAVQARA
jgi:hypothetical protein